MVVVASRLSLLRLFPNLRYIWISMLSALALVVIITPFSRFFLTWITGLPQYYFSELWQVALLIFLLALCIDLIRSLVVQSLREESTGDIAEQAPLPRLQARLPDELCGDILHISAAGHLVEVRTSAGKASIRMRLSDAISEMDSVVGFSTHRSHWVAHEAVTGHEVDGDRPVLVLLDGTRVPVSRTYSAGIEAHGFCSQPCLPEGPCAVCNSRHST